MSVATDYASVTSTRGTDVAIPATPASNRVPCLPGHRARNSIGSSSCRFRLSRELTLRTAAREYVWLYDYRHGMSLGEIALRDGISVKRVQFGVERARAQENGVSHNGVTDNPRNSVAGLRLIPLFPIGHYTPLSACPHKEPLEAGSSLCCMVCHKSGLDHHPSLQRDARTEPLPETKTKAPSTTQEVKSAPPETRKQRRNRRFSIDVV